MTKKYNSNGTSNLDVGLNNISSGIQTATGTGTSTATGKTTGTSETTIIEQTNRQMTTLANNLIASLNKKNDNTDYNVSISSVSNLSYFITIKKDFNTDNKLISGFNYNVSNGLDVIDVFTQLNAYSANSTVDYYSTIFPGVSNLKTTGLSLVNMGPNDYILYEITVPNKVWLYNHNYFSLAPYFYSYTKNKATTDVFGSVDIAIQFFDKFKTSGNKINICMTSSKTVANEFKNKGYIISKIPVEYINNCTFLPLFRVGYLNKYTFDINNFVKSYYYKSTSRKTDNNYTSSDVINSFPPQLLPNNNTFKNNLANFNSLVSYLNSNVCLSTLTQQTVKNLSNKYKTNFAVDNFFKAITTTPIAQLEGNNTGECYYNSSIINLTTTTQKYIYVLTLNQKIMETALTSNIQLYNTNNSQVISNGTINTSAELPKFTNTNYPYSPNNDKTYPLFQITGYNINTLTSVNITSLYVVERMSYNPINFYASSYEYTGSAYVLFGSQLSSNNINYLTSNYDILINYY